MSAEGKKTLLDILLLEKESLLEEELAVRQTSGKASDAHELIQTLANALEEGETLKNILIEDKQYSQQRSKENIDIPNGYANIAPGHAGICITDKRILIAQEAMEDGTTEIVALSHGALQNIRIKEVTSPERMHAIAFDFLLQFGKRKKRYSTGSLFCHLIGWKSIDELNEIRTAIQEKETGRFLEWHTTCPEFRVLNQVKSGTDETVDQWMSAIAMCRKHTDEDKTGTALVFLSNKRTGGIFGGADATEALRCYQKNNCVTHTERDNESGSEITYFRLFKNPAENAVISLKAGEDENEIANAIEGLVRMCKDKDNALFGMELCFPYTKLDNEYLSAMQHLMETGYAQKSVIAQIVQRTLSYNTGKEGTPPC